MAALFVFKIGLLAFWGLWFLIACLTNLCDSFKALQIFRRTWVFASGNSRELIKATEVWAPPTWFLRLMIFGVTTWQLLAVFFFGWAVVSALMVGTLNFEIVNAAFIIGLGLLGTFMLADEVLKQYDAEHSHILFFTAQLVSFIALYVQPSESSH